MNTGNVSTIGDTFGRIIMAVGICAAILVVAAAAIILMGRKRK